MHTVQLSLMRIFQMKTAKTKRKKMEQNKKKNAVQNGIYSCITYVPCVLHGACVFVYLEEKQKKKMIGISSKQCSKGTNDGLLFHC